MNSVRGEKGAAEAVLLSFGTYDRQFLLDLRHSVSDLAVFNHGGQNTLPPLLSGIPTHLYSASTSQRKLRRRRGKRSGRLVKLKVCLARSSSIPRTGHGLSPPFVVSRRFLEPFDICLVCVVCLDEGVRPRRPCSPQPRQRGVDPRNLRSLLRAPRSAEPQAPAPARIGLVNARSLANKTFVLRDFFSSRSLNFLWVTETWIGAGDHSALVELLPAGCSYFNSPRTSGRGGGTATVFKNDFKCKQRALSTSISSFEVTLFELMWFYLVLQLNRALLLVSVGDLTLSLPVCSLLLLISFAPLLTQPLSIQRSSAPGFAPPAEPY
ncbi:hypothetical protein MHYP_G00088870 [Metynnis hypsauchen]